MATPTKTIDPKNIPKIALPDLYHRDRSKLRAFLTQVKLYTGFNGHQFPTDTDKVLWAASHLRGPAFNWIETFLSDYMKNRLPDGRCSNGITKKSIKIFQKFEGFEGRINRVFGDIDQGRTAERNIQNLKQTGSATSYTTAFQQFANQTSWNNDALKAQYYKGLKDGVKDEVARSDAPSDLQDLIEIAVKIDNRNFERALEHKGNYRSETHIHHNREEKKPHYPREMEITNYTMSRKQGNKGKPRNSGLSKEVMNNRREKKLCYKCGLPGHIASSHRQKKQ